MNEEFVMCFHGAVLYYWEANVPLTLQTLDCHVYDFYVPTLPKAQVNLQQMYMKLQSEGMLTYISD
jgi:hypothetical protein